MIFCMRKLHRSPAALSRLALALLAVLALAQATRAQSAAPATAECSASVSFHFASVSVRSAQAQPSDSDGASDTGYSAHRISLRTMIGVAYGTNRIDGLPQWAQDARYDVTATVADEDLCLWCQMQHRGHSDDAIHSMLKGLLKDRFLLEYHSESRPVSGYALVLAKGGPKIKPAQPPTGLQPMGYFMDDNERWGILTMAEFAERLSTAVGHPVADKTGLTGYYQVNLSHRYTDRRNLIEADGSPVQNLPPSIFDELPGQLGLKLESGVKVPVPFLVIDHIEQPTEN
jgi:uncharacterized protein (TIGR03435 family)